MTNERLINSIAVAIVFVNGSGEYSISEDEKDNIIAEVIGGLDWLGSYEPDAKLTWHYDILPDVTVSISPWQGARWPGMPEDFY